MFAWLINWLEAPHKAELQAAKYIAEVDAGYRVTQRHITKYSMSLELIEKELEDLRNGGTANDDAMRGVYKAVIEERYRLNEEKTKQVTDACVEKMAYAETMVALRCGRLLCLTEEQLGQDECAMSASQRGVRRAHREYYAVHKANKANIEESFETGELVEVVVTKGRIIHSWTDPRGRQWHLVDGMYPRPTRAEQLRRVV